MELGLSLSLTGVRGGFSLAAFMASQPAGFWYDFTRSDTMFQENVGPTPADEPNEVIGLALSQRLWEGQTRTGYLAGQPENRQNGAPVLAGTATAATYNTTTGVGSVARVDFTNQSGVAISSLTGGRSYAVDVEVSGGLIIRDGLTPTSTYLCDVVTGRSVYYVTTGPVSTGLTLTCSEAGGTRSFTLHSVREVSQVPATQSTTSFKPKFQTTGAAFDGIDDNLLLSYLWGSHAGDGANFVVFDIDVPVTLAAIQAIIGSGPNTSDFTFLSISTSGKLRFGLRSVTFEPAEDLRGRSVKVGAAWNVDKVRLFIDDALALDTTHTVPPATLVTPLRIGANNNNGTAANFFGGSIRSALAGREFIDLARFNQIANALGA